MPNKGSRLAVVSAVCWLVVLWGCGTAPLDQLSAASADIDAIAGAVVPDELVVLSRAGAEEPDLAALFSDAGAAVRDELPAISAHLVGFTPSRREEVRAALLAAVVVEAIADNRLYETQAVPRDPRYSDQWHLTAIGGPAAWDITTGDENVLVAVLDSGIDNEHGEFSEKLVEGVNVYGANPDTRDLTGHGTAVAGIIAAASDNQQGVASVAWQNPLLPIRVTSEKGRTTSWLLAAGIRQAVSQGAKVINVSFAPLHDDTTVLRQARIARLAGSIVVASAGNSGEEMSGEPLDSIIFVGAVDRSDRRARFSTYGDFVDLTAPGVSIVTTKPGDTYGTYSGTSFAAPVVSGVAALVWSVNPNLRPVTVQDILSSTAKDLGSPGRDAGFGEGRVDARAAVELARTVVEADDVAAPTVVITAPADASTINADTTVTVQAGDDFDVAEVALLVDGAALASDAVAPYSFVLIASKYPAGEHVVTAVATDTSGNAAEHTIVVHLAGPADPARPGVVIRSPANGATVRGLITIVAEAWDDRALDLAQILVDGEIMATIPLFSETSSTIVCNWNTSAGDVPAGLHDLAVRVFDASGNQATFTVQVTVKK